MATRRKSTSKGKRVGSGRPGGTGGSAPAPPSQPPPDPDLPCLEDVLIGLQKSLARTVRSAQQASRSDSEFAQGERPVYMIDGLDIDLNAALLMPGGGANGSLLVDLNAPAAERSVIRFRVQAKPMEILGGAKLQLANMDPMGGRGKEPRLRVWLVDSDGRPVQHHRVTLYFARPGSRTGKSSTFSVETKTDTVGRVDFTIRTRDNSVKVVGTREPSTGIYLRPNSSSPERSDYEYFVWATCPRLEQWKKVVEPTAPIPPLSEAADKILFTELLRLRLYEE
jgi:hypothetical protein